MIEEVTAFEFVYRPFDSSYPIRSMVATIYAKTRKEAELIALDNNWKFFNQDTTVVVRELGSGYRQITDAPDRRIPESTQPYLASEAGIHKP